MLAEDAVGALVRLLPMPPVGPPSAEHLSCDKLALQRVKLTGSLLHYCIRHFRKETLIALSFGMLKGYGKSTLSHGVIGVASIFLCGDIDIPTRMQGSE